VILKILSALKDNTSVVVASNYDITSYNVTVKMAVWKTSAVSLTGSTLMCHMFLDFNCVLRRSGEFYSIIIHD